MSMAAACGRGLQTISLLRKSSPVLRLASTLAPSNPPSTTTHTGQDWDESDIRNVRFTHVEKEVNQRWAIDLIAKVPPIECSQRVVHCDGGGGALGHPRVYINLDSNEPVACIYCGLRYVYKP